MKTRIALKTHTTALRKTEETFKPNHFMNATVEDMKFLLSYHQQNCGFLIILSNRNEMKQIAAQICQNKVFLLPVFSRIRTTSKKKKIDVF